MTVSAPCCEDHYTGGMVVVNHTASAIESIKVKSCIARSDISTEKLPFMNLQHGSGGSGFIPIQEYGTEFHRSFKNKKAVRLLYTGKKHYDLLV